MVRFWALNPTKVTGTPRRLLATASTYVVGLVNINLIINEKIKKIKKYSSIFPCSIYNRLRKCSTLGLAMYSSHPDGRTTLNEYEDILHIGAPYVKSNVWY